MSSILIAYGSAFGQTAKIVERVAARLTGSGHQVTIWKGDELPPGASLAGFDAVLVAGSVIFGRHQPYLDAFVRANLARMNALPTAFLSVCGVLAGTWEQGPAEARRYEARFLKRTGWKPRLVKSFAGGLPYTRYGVITRWLMKLISRRIGRPTDTSRDWDLTDWDAVDHFAEALGALGATASVAGRSG